MQVFVAHSFSENLSKDYYELILKVYDLIKKYHHKILVGGLLIKLKDDLKKYEDVLCCYSLEKYLDEQKLLPGCEYILTSDVYERTKELETNSDMVVVLPGGSGSLSEIFSILEDYKYKDSPKKIYLLDYHNHYQDLINYLKNLEKHKFNKNIDLSYLKVINLEELENILESGNVK